MLCDPNNDCKEIDMLISIVEDDVGRKVNMSYLSISLTDKY